MLPHEVLKRVYFVRHGESESNAKLIHFGDEVSLTERGIEQARLVADRFCHIHIDVILTSDSKRAVQTAEEIKKAQMSSSIITYDLLREKSLPSETLGKSYANPERNKINSEMAANRSNPAWRYSDEENFFDTRTRARKALDLIEERVEKDILVIAHGTFLRMIIGTMADREFSHELYDPMMSFMKISNTGITLCEKWEDHAGVSWKLVTWNDIAHLGE